MRSNPGPGGTMLVELEGVGVNWMLRPSAEGVRLVQWGGTVPGQRSGFIMVPDRQFALTVLTNSEGGADLLAELFVDDWALRRFAGVSNLPAKPRALSRAELAPYEGRYTGQGIDFSGAVIETNIELKDDNGRLRMTQRTGVESAVPGNPSNIAETEDTPEVFHLVFYRDDYVLVYDESGQPNFSRANFLRDANGGVVWLRFHGRLYRRLGGS
ncbi:MAG: hypothetical protein ACRDTC_26190 [Pseudonocardiaceae bacterium]